MFFVLSLSNISFSSMHNSRIERLWVEAGKQFVRQWQGFFLHLERLHQLDRDNPHHLWLLQHLYLDLINADCNAFAQDWNLHPLSSQSNQTPLDLRFLNESLHGMAIDVFKDVHPDLLQCYHSVLGDPIHWGSQQTGAGYLSGEEESGSDVTTVSDGADPGSDMEESEQTTLEQAISSHISANVKHEAIKCPRHLCPFDDLTYIPLFDAALRHIQASSLIPAGYGLDMLEWDGGEYPASELIRFGRKKEIIVDLPLAIWMPWALAWVQGLYAMNTFREHISNE
ncbi:hypothetical protein JB92DRAFT_3167860 [Gautieria morchelliformis]|nr:hypothetical protein JB92DRAFT_3167860 [Gautieria morchelliformis]